MTCALGKNVSHSTTSFGAVPLGHAAIPKGAHSVWWTTHVALVKPENDLRYVFPVAVVCLIAGGLTLAAGTVLILQGAVSVLDVSLMTLGSLLIVVALLLLWGRRR
jgi:hypothetical protein